MKNKKLLFLPLILVLLASCGANGGNLPNGDPNAFSDQEYTLLTEDSDYTLYIHKEGTFHSYYHILFGKNNVENFIIQYDFTYTYLSNKSHEQDEMDKAYEGIIAHIDEIRVLYNDSTLNTRKSGEVSVQQVEVNNPTKAEIEIVSIESYISFASRNKYTYNIDYFMVPFKVEEYKKIGDQIELKSGELVEFSTFIEQNHLIER